GLGQPARPAGNPVGQGGQIAVQRDQGGGATLPLGDQLLAAPDQAGEPTLEDGQLAGQPLVFIQRGHGRVPGRRGGRLVQAAGRGLGRRQGGQTGGAELFGVAPCGPRPPLCFDGG